MIYCIPRDFLHAIVMRINSAPAITYHPPHATLVLLPLAGHFDDVC